MPRLIPPPGDPITIDQAESIMSHYGYDAGELAAGAAVALRDRGYRVHYWTLFDPDDLVRAWNAPSDVAMIALVHYAPSSSIAFDAVQIRLDKITGIIFIWDGRGALGEG